MTLCRYSLAGLAVLASCFSVAAAMAEEISFKISNPAGPDIVEIYASPVHFTDMPDTPIAGSAIAAGASAGFTIPDGFCAYDLWFLVADGRWYYDTADFCDFPTYVFTPVEAGWLSEGDIPPGP